MVQVCSLRVLLDPARLQEAKVAAMARNIYIMLWLVYQLDRLLEKATTMHAIINFGLDYCNVLYARMFSDTLISTECRR